LSGSFSGKVSQLPRIVCFCAFSNGKWYYLTLDDEPSCFRVSEAPSYFKGRATLNLPNDAPSLVPGIPYPVQRVDITCSDGTLVYYTKDHEWVECSDDYIPTSDATSAGAAPSDAAPSGAAMDDEHPRDTLARIHGYGAASSGNIFTPSARSRFEFAAPVAAPVAPSDNSDSDSESSVITTVQTKEEIIDILSNLLSGGGASGGGGGGGSRRRRHRNRSKGAPRSNR